MIARGMPVAALLALLVASASARNVEPPNPLPWRVGGGVGFTVDAGVFPDSTGYSAEVYLRLPPTTLEQLTQDFHGAARLRLSAELKSGYGSHRHTATQEFDIAPGDSGGGFGKVVLLRFPTRPGAQRLSVKLEDAYSRKVGLAYLGRVGHESSKTEGEFDASPPVAGRDLSDIEFVWTEQKGGARSAFERSGRERIPNPERLYGLFAEDLCASFAARSADGTRPWHWLAKVLDAQGQVVASRESTAAADPRLDATVTMSMAREPAGGYDLDVQVWQEGDPHPLERRARFSVAWQRESWLRNPRDTEDMVHLLTNTDEEENFLSMHPGEQERWLDDFWRLRDPTPGTAANEAREGFLRRVDIANERFGRNGIARGMFSDMGRVFIRYGEPSEILRQVMPAGDQTLLQVIREISLSEDRPIGELRQKGPGGDMRPFEVWTYEGEIPVPPDADPSVGRNPRHKRLLFLFVDEQGLGDFRLRYSTE